MLGCNTLLAWQRRETSGRHSWLRPGDGRQLQNYTLTYCQDESYRQAVEMNSGYTLQRRTSPPKKYSGGIVPVCDKGLERSVHFGDRRQGTPSDLQVAMAQRGGQGR